MARRLGGRYWHRETLRQRLAKQLFAAAGNRIVVAGATKWAAMAAAMTEITEREVAVVRNGSSLGQSQWCGLSQVTAAYVSETKVRQPAPRCVYEFTSKNVQEQRRKSRNSQSPIQHALDHEVVLKRLIRVNFRVERKSRHAFVVLTFLIALLVVTRHQKSNGSSLLARAVRQAQR